MISFGKLTDSQIAFLETNKWHLEQLGCGAAGDRTLRTVFPDLKMVGRWFSDNWDVVAWDFVKPTKPMGTH